MRRSTASITDQKERAPGERGGEDRVLRVGVLELVDRAAPNRRECAGRVGHRTPLVSTSHSLRSRSSNPSRWRRASRPRRCGRPSSRPRGDVDWIRLSTSTRSGAADRVAWLLTHSAGADAPQPVAQRHRDQAFAPVVGRTLERLGVVFEENRLEGDAAPSALSASMRWQKPCMVDTARSSTRSAQFG